MAKTPAAPAKPTAPKKTTTAAKPAAEHKAPKEPKVKVERITQNDVTRPKDGSVTGKVWDIADAISKKKGEPATRAEVMEQAEKDGINEATVATQFQRWRTFFGVERKPAAPKPEKAPKAAKAPAAPAAPKKTAAKPVKKAAATA
jgi:hypothetical protein